LIPDSVVQVVNAAVRRAGRREVGGVLLGEHLGSDLFRVLECTVQMHGGTSSSFVRMPEAVDAALRHFYERHNFDYSRFNYLGEWHSHPSFALIPSCTDEQTMLGIVRDPDSHASFAVLMLARLESDKRLSLAGMLYRRGERVQHVTLELEDKSGASSTEH